MLFLFFKQKTAYEMRISDWSSDVCSSDLFATQIHQHRSTHWPKVLRRKSTRHFNKNLGVRKGWNMESGFYWTSSMLLSIFLKPINAAITVLRTYGAMPKWSTTRVRNSNRTKKGKQRYA